MLYSIYILYFDNAWLSDMSKIDCQYKNSFLDLNMALNN